MTAPIHHTSRPRHSAGHTAGDPVRGQRPPGGTGKRSVRQLVWRQLPFFVWLVALWMLLWGQFTAVAFITGVIAAVAVTRVFRLPPVELSGRVNLWYGLVFVLTFLGAVVRGSLTVAWQVLDFRRQPGTAIIAVPLRIDDDLIMTHTAVTASLIPGSLIVDADRDRRVLYLHVIGVRSAEDVEAQRRSVLRWERRIVRAVGSRRQLELVDQDGAPVASPGGRS
ncbi:MAG: Na+/H+ antiporter subunit E [Microbacterium sp.]